MSSRLCPIVVVLLTTFAGYHLLMTLRILIVGAVLMTSSSSGIGFVWASGFWVLGAALSLAAVVPAGVVWKRSMIADLIIGPTDTEETAINRTALVSSGLGLMSVWMILANLPMASISLVGHLWLWNDSSLFSRAPTNLWVRVGSSPSTMLGVGFVLFFLHAIIARLLVREPERDVIR